jgi:hypothetical protein
MANQLVEPCGVKVTKKTQKDPCQAIFETRESGPGANKGARRTRRNGGENTTPQGHHDHQEKSIKTLKHQNLSSIHSIYSFCRTVTASIYICPQQDANSSGYLNLNGTCGLQGHKGNPVSPVSGSLRYCIISPPI